ncbi:DUF2255 family protein [Streptomyces arenae]|uniref:DUF2255 family protein n=1 Tax=Streptomyces arenae TaxID=29301 RepID=UPI0026587624|nr:DUF2255 family protein [Streptomyces arenae]MCG7205212.1 DUF2255 family protein [Streptomyces arenae]
MTEWSRQQLESLDTTCSLLLMAGDGGTDGPQVEIGMVVVGGECFVRAYRGAVSRWYQAALKQGTGSIAVGDQLIEVVFSPAETALGGEIDRACSTKYGSLASSANGSRMKEATLLVRPL